ncbi:hypothetical protein AcV5_008350 [Taiwanofungus camphoratus]|nr:hypothetical protein AcV5_008350 [Antrodia cinnamomea]
MPPIFPIEIFERIIDFLSGDHPFWLDRQTLSYCALTCRAWLPRSRYHLFHDVTIRNSRQLYRFAKQLTASPHLDGLVDELSIVYPHPRLLNVVPIMLARKLTKVNRLRIHGGLLEQLRLSRVDQKFLMPLAEFASITQFELIDATFAKLTDFGRLICAFTNLSILTCMRVGWPQCRSKPPSFACYRSHFKLKGLFLESCPISDIVDWLLAVSSVERVETVMLPSLDLEHLHSTGRLLRSIGSSLHSLTIGFSAFVNESVLTDAIERHLGLAHTTSLVSLHLVHQHHSSQEAHCKHFWSWVHTLLLQVKSYDIRQLRIDILHKVQTSDLDSLLCDHIDNTLSSPQFSAIETLTIMDSRMFFTETNMDWLHLFHSEILRRFPRSYTRGIIRFGFICIIDATIRVVPLKGKTLCMKTIMS